MPGREAVPTPTNRTSGRRTAGPLTCLAMLLSAWLLLAAPPASAASYDPELTWQTLRTEHFKITFHDGLEQQAEELGQLCDGVYDKVSPRIGTELERPVELVLVDHTDSANGYAAPLPVNTLVIFVTAPQESGTLNLYADWNEAILTHELTHILHLDTVEGLPRVLRLVLGRDLAQKRIRKEYLAIVEGAPEREEWRVDAPIGNLEASEIRIKKWVVPEGSSAVTDFRVMESRGSLTLLAAKPITGRTNQIRIHAAYAGHRIIGDKLYHRDERVFLEYFAKGNTPWVVEQAGFDRLCLHAYMITFSHPETKEACVVRSPLPPDMSHRLDSNK